MRRKGADLAARFRRAIRSDRDEKVEQERARDRALEAARAARGALLEELAAFAEAVGFLEVVTRGEALVVRYSDDVVREIVFTPSGDADRVQVGFTGQPAHEHHELYRQPELGDLWVWSIRRVRREDRLPLFDAGLEELLVRGLNLPRPGDSEPGGGPRTL
ncbi:MAG: hypothetical protein ACI8PZ_002428 [Myxococcota bacterium]|jgi:hypothetical protein